MKVNRGLFITAFLFGSILLGCKDKDETIEAENHDQHGGIVMLSAESIRQIKLETGTVALQPYTPYLTIPAKVITNQDHEAQIGSLVEGRVHKVFVNVGDYVRAGQILMTVEGLNIGEIKAGFLIARAMLDYTRANYERQQKLLDEKIGSLKVLLESRAEYEKALAEYKAEDKRIHSVGLTDEDVTEGQTNEEHTSGTLPIKSSINGVVVERNVVIGQLVDAATTAFKVINISSVWIDGQIYEKDLQKINQKTNAVFTSTSNPNEIFKGRIIYIGQTVDERTRTITVRGEFSNPKNKLKPQMFGELKIPVDSMAEAILIPDEAVVKETGEEYVFVQTSDTTTPGGGQAFEKRTVITGIADDSQIEIREGLKVKEKVVTKGVFYLKSELKKEEIAGDEH